MATRRELERRLFELQCEICKAVSHPLRLEIVDLLSRRGRSAAELIEALETSKANVSKHVNQLVQAGVVEASREGRAVRYRLTHPEIHEACSIMRSILYRRLKQGGAIASVIDISRRRRP